MVNDLLFRTAVLLGGASIIGVAMAIHPVSAGGAHHAMRSKPVTCRSHKTCVSAANTSNSPAIQGVNSGTGVALSASSANADGMTGETLNPSTTHGTHAGVSGYDNSTDGGTNDLGVYGQSLHGVGVLGGSSTLVGVSGFSYSSVAVFGQSHSSVSVSGTGVGGNEITSIQAIGGTNNDAAGLTFAAFQQNGAASFWVDNSSNAYVGGQLIQCNFGCSSANGGTGAYTAQSSTPTLEDVGEGHLVNGSARISFDAPLTRAIDRAATYAVFVSPEGPNRGLYVTNKTASGFTVAENPGGRDTIPFSYRLVARPSGVTSSPRLPKVPHVPKPVFTRVTSRRIGQ